LVNNSPRHRYACRPSLRLRRKEGEEIFSLFLWSLFPYPIILPQFSKPPLSTEGEERDGERSKARVSQIANYLLLLTMASIIDLCRVLRQRETPAEKILWQHLRNRKLIRKKFLRQYPICVQSSFGRNIYYIPDFYCHAAKLVVEADGPIHQFKKEYDNNRDEVLSALKLTILRFENAEILDNVDAVLSRIKEKL
jgi:very-short-patch-repair endonuclease